MSDTDKFARELYTQGILGFCYHPNCGQSLPEDSGDTCPHCGGELHDEFFLTHPDVVKSLENQNLRSAK